MNKLTQPLNPRRPAPTHGGKIFKAAARLGVDWRDILDFSANINPLGTPPGLKERLFDEFDLTLHYPETHGQSLARLVGGKYGLPPERVVIGPGSTVQMHMLMRLIQPQKAVIISPAFGEYEGALKSSGLGGLYLSTREEDDFAVTGETLSRLWDLNPDLVFVANPANPTGRLVDPDLMTVLVEGAHQRKIWLLIDEAFLDFTRGFSNSFIPRVTEYPRLVVLKSLTKIYALPGLRLAFMALGGYAASLVENRVEPWSTNALALTAGFHCLGLIDFNSRTRNEVERLRNILLQGLNSFNLGRILPAEANYVLWRLPRPRLAQDILDGLFNHGILVRDAANFHGLSQGYLRLAVRPEAEISRLLDRLRAILPHLG